MGEDAAETTEATETEALETEVKEELEAVEEKETTCEGEPETKEVEEEFEVVRESEESQSSTGRQSGFQKRVNKLNEKIGTAKSERDSANTEKAILEEKNKLLQIALEQAREGKSSPAEAPNPDEFEAGIYDPAFIKQKEAWTDARIEKRIAEGIDKATKQTVQTQTDVTVTREQQQVQVEHYGRAEKLKVKDYEEMEDKAIEILGNDYVKHIIGSFDKSENILYYLGKNPKKAEALVEILKRNPIRGVAEIARIESSIKIVPKTKTIPNPDEELEGAVPAGPSAVERKLDKLREEAAKSGKMDKLLAFKKELREKAKT